MRKCKSLLEYTNLFSPNEYKQNDQIIKTFFSWIDFKKVRIRKTYCIKCKKYKEFKKPKISYVFVIKHYFFLVFARECKWREKIFMEGESIEILKILGLINNIDQ